MTTSIWKWGLALVLAMAVGAQAGQRGRVLGTLADQPWGGEFSSADPKRVDFADLPGWQEKIPGPVTLCLWNNDPTDGDNLLLQIYPLGATIPVAGDLTPPAANAVVGEANKVRRLWSFNDSLERPRALCWTGYFQGFRSDSESGASINYHWEVQE